MNKDLRNTDYLRHILQAINRIKRYAKDKGKIGFLQDEMMQDAIIRNIEIIGEAASRISSEFSTKHDAIPWRDIAGMRHRLIHGYFKVNLNTVWKVVEKDLPELEDQVHALLDELDIEGDCSPP
ncbi:DUF86 domain-containing protein [Nitrosococcus wardiae]|uniref:DUF86 domain-containing protein n=1 Tax=Nitrosococcus wardiae TaxID=1814290 RepID=A0A4P7BVQ7_9GAMM|nr:DUF86 domain-containing protein [Nitrosococcus wardiae]QBQ53269.1 DUF86 domain-containing protein [Nitrosococcus wardiae]